MERSSLSEFQKQTFRYAFEDIIQGAPIKIQRLWDGKIIWDRDLPVFNNGIHMKLQGKSAEEYEQLIYQLNKRLL